MLNVSIYSQLLDRNVSKLVTMFTFFRHKRHIVNMFFNC